MFIILSIILQFSIWLHPNFCYLQKDHLRLNFSEMELKCPSCKEDILISDEDASSIIECPFCQQRISISEPEPKQPPVINQKQEPSAIGGEKTFYQDQSVIVTDKRVVLAGKTYALKQITSVGMAVDHHGPKLIFGKSAWMVFLVSLIISILIFTGSAVLSITYAKFDSAENPSSMRDAYEVELIKTSLKFLFYNFQYSTYCNYIYETLQKRITYISVHIFLLTASHSK